MAKPTKRGNTFLYLFIIGIILGIGFTFGQKNFYNLKGEVLNPTNYDTNGENPDVSGLPGFEVAQTTQESTTFLCEPYGKVLYDEKKQKNCACPAGQITENRSDGKETELYCRDFLKSECQQYKLHISFEQCRVNCLKCSEEGTSPCFKCELSLDCVNRLLSVNKEYEDVERKILELKKEKAENETALSSAESEVSRFFKIFSPLQRKLEYLRKDIALAEMQKQTKLVESLNEELEATETELKKITPPYLDAIKKHEQLYRSLSTIYSMQSANEGMLATADMQKKAAEKACST